ncbi:polyprenyl synthetase family protein [Glutamicibacter sp. MNS18]|uniref:polyprenyl synthetase family protein n=1 Tax=Glutamicibacter sp. MNS18 TaxID=2989817 RepID=UPI0022369C58|nr:polyprenyl synthetase family protein [Glutamicibacter sp. MNS18]MCW4466112.1 polyprenyl synthetase family protein [Glutamicibacter sp. MNS18]
MTATHPSPQRTRQAPASHHGEAEEELIRAQLQQLLQDQQRRTARYSRATADLWQRIAPTVGAGKLTRPKLVSLGYRTFGGKDQARSIDLGCAFELLHSALLMHDDVIDRDFIRRGRPTLSAHYRDQARAAGLEPAAAEHVGGSAGIIAGDLLLSAAIRQAARAAAGLPAAEAVGQAFELAVAQAGAGELEDLLYSVQALPANTAEVLRMEELKTAGYSFQLPLLCGALLAGASETEAAGISDIGCRLGVAYQVVDDILGCFGDPRSTGKSVESDLREGKSTVLTALASEDADFQAELAAYRNGSSSIQALRQALHRSGAAQTAHRLAASLCTAALQSPHFNALPPHTQQELQGYATFILERKV